MRSMNLVRNLAILALLALFGQGANAATTILPPGQTCYAGVNGAYSSGSMNFFIPNTTTPKATFRDSAQAAMNTQPIQLDSNGCAIVYGVGSYRQQLFDGPVIGGVTTGNLIFDLTTTDTSAYNSVFWAGTAGGTPNVITIVDTGFNGTDGTVVQFVALATNTGSTTINPSGFSNILVQKSTTAGPVSLVGGEIVAGNVISAVYSASSNTFQLLNAVIQSASGATAPLCGATGLKVFNDFALPNTKVDATAAQMVMQTPSGVTINRSNVSIAANFTTNGVNGLDTGVLSAATWYNIWAIDNGATTSALGSISATAPTMPSGYTYKCRLGTAQTDVSSHFRSFLQSGSSTSITIGSGALPIIASGVAGTVGANPVLVSATIAGNGFCVPPTATDILINASSTYTNASAANVLVAPDTSWSGTGNGPAGANGVVWPLYLPGATAMNLQVALKLEATTIYWASSAAGGALACQGYKDAVNAN